MIITVKLQRYIIYTSSANFLKMFVRIIVIKIEICTCFYHVQCTPITPSSDNFRKMLRRLKCENCENRRTSVLMCLFCHFLNIQLSEINRILSGVNVNCR